MDIVTLAHLPDKVKIAFIVFESPTKSQITQIFSIQLRVVQIAHVGITVTDEEMSVSASKKSQCLRKLSLGGEIKELHFVPVLDRFGYLGSLDGSTELPCITRESK